MADCFVPVNRNFLFTKLLLTLSTVHAGMTLTQIYSQYVEVSESYEKEKQERQQVRVREAFREVRVLSIFMAPYTINFAVQTGNTSP